MFASLLLLALSAPALATVFTTSPVASSVFTGGKEATISWQDDGTSPSLKEFGPAMVSIYVGNAQQQTRLQSIVASVDVSTTQSIKFTPDASIGPDSSEYFIRFESLSLKDAKAPQYPALAFSAKFTLSGMSGQFNASVQAQINGQSTAPLAGATSAPASSGNFAASATSRLATSSSASASRSATSARATTNGAVGVRSGWVGVVIGAFVGAAML